MGTAVTFRSNQQIDLQVQGQYADGSPAPIQGVVSWFPSNTNLCTLAVDPADSTKCTLKGKSGPAISGTVTARATGVPDVVFDVTVTSMYAAVMVVLSVGVPTAL